MTNDIILPQQLEQAIYRIKCGDEYGSAFAITQDLLMTAWHVIYAAIEDSIPVVLFVKDGLTDVDKEVYCRVKCYGTEQLDVAVLQVEGLELTNVLPMSSIPIRYGAAWETFGFPFEQQQTGNRYKGEVRKINKIHPYDVELTAIPLDNKSDFGGLSGSPLLIGGQVAGILTWNILDGFGAISIKKLGEFFDTYNIPYTHQRSINDLPENFEEDLKAAISNETTIEILNKKLISGGKYYLLHGSPGSGKTIISASIDFETDQRQFVGRYFIRVPNDERALSYRTSKEAFMEWLEDLISQKLSGHVYPKKNIGINERIKNLESLLGALNEHYKKSDQIGFIIIDGLDDVAGVGGGLSEYLATLPELLPSNLSILMSMIRKDILPVGIRSQITDDETIQVAPLVIDSCAGFLERNVAKSEGEIPYSQYFEIARRSEGHPLYLRYLMEILRDDTPDDLSKWISELPKIDGDIAKYYERIWLTDFSADDEKLWIALTTSQLRQPLTAEDLVEMLPDNSKIAFVSKFPAIRHLFHVKNKISIYHSSFSLFVEEKANLLIPLAHDQVKLFFRLAPKHEYTITNSIYHTLKSSDSSPAIDMCDQDWADNCALIGVEPELVISDIQQVERYCIRAANFTSLVRIKLLLGRIRFRYNNLLVQNASRIAKLLMSLGKPDQAIRYIVRSSVLIVSDESALNFLKDLYFEGADEEADVLLKAIQKRYRYLFEDGLDKGSISFRTYRLLANSTSITSLRHPETAMNKVADILSSLRRQSLEPHLTGDEKRDIEGLRREIGSYHAGFITYANEHYTISAEKMKAQMPLVPVSDWTGRIAQNAIAFDHFLDNEKNAELTKANQNLINDLEYAFDNFGYNQDEAYLILSALFTDSHRTDIVKKLIPDVYTEEPQQNIRLPNGVDADFYQIYKAIHYMEAIGYADVSTNFPKLQKMTQGYWEQGLVTIIKKLAYCTGRSYYYRAMNLTVDLAKALTEFDSIIKALKFNLLDRSKWDRAYTLPEQIIPHIYFKITSYLIEFNPGGIPKFVADILADTSNQLGLYTEGYRGSLSSIARQLAKYKRHQNIAFRMIKTLHEHTLIATLNRWERAPALLDIAQFYADIGNSEKSELVYKEMLDTSMGPTWYKEDQMTIINTVLSLPLADMADEHFQTFAIQLEFAAGELTFQRYVRVAQQRYICNLAQHHNVRSAIAYFKYQTLPDAVQIILNAESSKVDAVRPGDGYILGASAIIEADGIANLLEKVEADPLIIWALAEIYVVSDDTERYLNDFAIIQANCLNKLFSTGHKEQVEILISRLVSHINSAKLRLLRTRYIKDLTFLLHPEINQILTKAGVDIPVKKEKRTNENKDDDQEVDDATYEKFALPGYGKHSNHKKIPDLLTNASAEREMENFQKARETLAIGLNMLHQGESDIWMGKYLSEKVGNLLDDLSEIATTGDIITLLAAPITEHRTEDWRVCDTLLTMVGKQLSREETLKVLDVVREHIHLLLRNPQDIDHFKWQADIIPVGRTNEQELSDLLIWMLNHPDLNVAERVLDSILFIAQLFTPVLNELIDNILSQNKTVSRELSAFILHKLSEQVSSELEKVLLTFKNYRISFLDEKHFMIRYYLLRTVENLGKQSEIFKALYQDMVGSFPDSIKTGGDTLLDDPYMGLIQKELDALQKAGIMNGMVCQDFLERIDQFSKPLTMFGQIRANHYLERSYHELEEGQRRTVNILRSALNYAILPRVTKGTIESISEILTLPYLK